MPEQSADLIIVGAGILGLAHAYHAAARGLKTIVFERDAQAMGASVRNFGMIISAIVEPGEDYRRAVYGESIWSKIAPEAKIGLNQCGALMVAQNEQEMTVLDSFSEHCPDQEQAILIESTELNQYSKTVNTDGKLGGLWMPRAMKVDQRNAMGRFSSWLESTYDVDFHFSSEVIEINFPKVRTNRGVWQADHVIVCGGNEFKSLYPDHFARIGMTNCQLQMLRTPPQTGLQSTEPFVLGGLSYARYAAFQDCDGIEPMKQLLNQNFPEHIKHGIHVIAAQEPDCSITLGDSHHYGSDIPPERLPRVDQLILEYANSLVSLPDETINQRWIGQYASLPEKKFVNVQPEPGVNLVTITNGQGMTIGFALAKDVVDKLF